MLTSLWLQHKMSTFKLYFLKKKKTGSISLTFKKCQKHSTVHWGRMQRPIIQMSLFGAETEKVLMKVWGARWWFRESCGPQGGGRHSAKRAGSCGRTTRHGDANLNDEARPSAFCSIFGNSALITCWSTELNRLYKLDLMPQCLDLIILLWQHFVSVDCGNVNLFHDLSSIIAKISQHLTGTVAQLLAWVFFGKHVFFTIVQKWVQWNYLVFLMCSLKERFDSFHQSIFESVLSLWHFFYMYSMKLA